MNNDIEKTTEDDTETTVIVEYTVPVIHKIELPIALFEDAEDEDEVLEYLKDNIHSDEQYADDIQIWGLSYE